MQYIFYVGSHVGVSVFFFSPDQAVGTKGVLPALTFF